MIRPTPARWFEVLAARTDASLLLEALAATGAVELQARAADPLPDEWTQLGPGLAEFAALNARYAHDWPQQSVAPSHCPEPPAQTLTRGLQALREWSGRCESSIRRLQDLQRQRAEVERWLGALRSWGPTTQLIPADLATTGGVIGIALVSRRQSVASAASTPALERLLDLAGTEELLIWLAPRAVIAESMAASASAREWVLPAPAWLPTSWDALDDAAAAQLQAIASDEQHLREAIAAHSTELAIAQVLADLDRMRWLVQHVRGLQANGVLVSVHGWTSARDGKVLSAALSASGGRALLHFPPHPEGADPPLLLRNPAWIRPFELFSRAFGVPGRDEADPTAVVAVAAPLLFGYMFGDIGQGAVIACVGYWLRKRTPLGRLLLAGGLASMLFGWVFGSIFAVEGWVDPLWLHPLSHPLAVLKLPLIAGAGLMLCGLALNLLSAWWRRQWREWCLRDAAVLLCYLGLLGLTIRAEAQYLLLAGLGIALAAPLLLERSALAMAASIGGLIEHTLQLLINTLSFARVGAFALAHAGLSSAVVLLADSADHGLLQALVLLLGNLLILTLEALVVSIQTTRLLLFEFFTRFLTASGRVFKPLPLPPSATPAALRISP